MLFCLEKQGFLPDSESCLKPSSFSQFFLLSLRQFFGGDESRSEAFGSAVVIGYGQTAVPVPLM